MAMLGLIFRLGILFSMPVPKGYTLDAPQHESKDAKFPPELERVQQAVGAEFVQGKPFAGYGGKPVIASVAPNEPHKIEINDKGKWNQAPIQEKAHELTHLWQNQLPPKLQENMPADGQHPYDLSNIDTLRSQGIKLHQLPREQAARIVQEWVANPSARARLQPWIDDMRTTPLSVMQPTGPNDKEINRNPRAPVPPVEAYASPNDLIREAKRRNPNSTVKTQ